MNNDAKRDLRSLESDAITQASRPAPRRGLNRVEAARYIGVSPSFFDRLIDDGRMPRPRCLGSRRLWDIRELDDHFDDLPAAPAADDGKDLNPWDDDGSD